MIRNNFVISLLIILLVLFASCGRRGDPVAVAPYSEVIAVKALNISVSNNKIYLNWGTPAGEDFPDEALKGFVVFRAEIPEGEQIQDCECKFRSLDFIPGDSGKNFKYMDKKAVTGQAYAYKIVVMDNNNRMSKDSNIVTAGDTKAKSERPKISPPAAPTELMAVYTQKSIVLTWDEIPERESVSYVIYRSTGLRFDPVGETVTPAFTDKDIEPSLKYYYRVTAIIKNTEGPPSEEISIVTEIH